MEIIQEEKTKISKYKESLFLIRLDSNIRNGSENGKESGHPNQTMQVAIGRRQVEIHEDLFRD